jgi:hypothetical protein
MRLAEVGGMGGFTGGMRDWFFPGGLMEQPHRLVCAVDIVIAEMASTTKSSDAREEPAPRERSSETAGERE